MKLLINFCSNYIYSYYSYYDTDEGALYFEVKLSSKLKGDLSHINKIVVSKKHYYDVEYVEKTADGAYLFKMVDYYNHWFERNMK